MYTHLYNVCLFFPEATFACRFVEMMMKSVGREIPIIVDLNLESSAFYVPLEISS